VNVCSECGREWPEAAKFCPFDGTGLGASESEGAPPEKTPEETVTNLIETLSEKKETRKYTPEPPQASNPEPESLPAETTESEEELGKFSETSWFMAASDLEELSQDTENVKIDEEKYRPDADLEAEIRRKFSLRESEDSDK